MPILREEHGEEELAVLPAHTKVLVTGNHRTKPIHVGLQGIVKEAGGLGGWYWLVLTNGDEVRLQRNALSVIEAPREEEDDELKDVSFNSSTSTSTRASNQKLVHVITSVDLRKLELASLWRYCRHFRLLQPSKEQLVEAVERHFISQQLDEFQVIAGFLQAAKRMKYSMQGGGSAS